METATDYLSLDDFFPGDSESGILSKPSISFFLQRILNPIM